MANAQTVAISILLRIFYTRLNLYNKGDFDDDLSNNKLLQRPF
jgi:hypothetical protein